jgi:hypothetical protein
MEDSGSRKGRGEWNIEEGKRKGLKPGFIFNDFFAIVL